MSLATENLLPLQLVSTQTNLLCVRDSNQKMPKLSIGSSIFYCSPKIRSFQLLHYTAYTFYSESVAVFRAGKLLGSLKITYVENNLGRASISMVINYMNTQFLI